MPSGLWLFDIERDKIEVLRAQMNKNHEDIALANDRSSNYFKDSSGYGKESTSRPASVTNKGSCLITINIIMPYYTLF